MYFYVYFSSIELTMSNFFGINCEWSLSCTSHKTHARRSVWCMEFLSNKIVSNHLLMRLRLGQDDALEDGFL